MRETLHAAWAPYAGETSGHHYFRDFFQCDSGMLPWMMIAQLLSQSGDTLAEAVAAMRAQFPSSGEINFQVEDASATLSAARDALEAEAVHIDSIDGLSMAFDGWRFNLRASTTEPLLRLNVEGTRGVDVRAKVQLLRHYIRGRQA